MDHVVRDDPLLRALDGFDAIAAPDRHPVVLAVALGEGEFHAWLPGAHLNPGRTSMPGELPGGAITSMPPDGI
jgi:hypothetical protein